MAIDYDSGTGLFDKLGRVVKIVNTIDDFERTNPSGAGQVFEEFEDLEGELEDDKEFDRIASGLLLNEWASIKNMLAQMKIRITNMVQPLLASEIIDAENFGKTDLKSLLDELHRLMQRDSQTIRTLAPGLASGPGTPPPTGDFHVFIESAPTKDEFGEELNCLPFYDEIRFTCVDNKTKGGEVFSIVGKTPPLSRGSNDYENQIDRGIGISGKTTIRSVESAFNLIANGSFDKTDGSPNYYPAGWNNLDAFNTTLAQSSFGSRSLSMDTNGTVSIVIPANKFKRGKKYLILVALRKVTGASGNMVYGLTGDTTQTTTTAISSISDSAWVEHNQILNVPEKVKSDYVMSITRNSTGGGTVYVDGVGVYEMGVLPNNVFYTLSQCGKDQAFDTGVLPVIDDIEVITITPTEVGEFSRFFSKYFDKNLPSVASAGQTISETLATA